MAKRPNVFALLKSTESFVKSVPINPKSANYKKWLENRAETKKALRDIYKILGRLEIMETRDFIYPCKLIPQKQILDWLVPCRKVLLKYGEPAFLRYCGKVLSKYAAVQFKEPVKKA